MLLEDFYEEILKELGALAAEETASASDRLAAKTKYESVWAELDDRDLMTWFDDEDVPDTFVDAMSKLVAERMTSAFSVPQDRRIEMKLNAQNAMDVIVGTGQRRGGFAPPDTEYF